MSISRMSSLAETEKDDCVENALCPTNGVPKGYLRAVDWSMARKLWVSFVICYYTFVVYCGSSIIIPSYQQMMLKYNHTEETTSLVLATYVVGYGIGPLLFSPLSEIPEIGRNPPYIISFALFLLISIILWTVDNFPAIVTLRFLQGFFGSPCLASGGATLEDLFGLSNVPLAYIFWVLGFMCAPALGPLLATFAVSADWRWPFWEIIAMAAPLCPMLLFLPETNPHTLALHGSEALMQGPRALRRQVTAMRGLPGPRVRGILVQAIIKPLEISVKDPAIGFCCVYVAIIYAIFYSFFEAFPLMYPVVYRFSDDQTCIVYLSILVGSGIAAVIYGLYTVYKRGQTAGSTDDLESRLFLAIPATVLVTIGLFVFAWTSRASIHWVVPTIGVAVYSGATYVVFQSLLCYVPLVYPRYVSSLFAANDFARSVTAAGFVMFSRPMYLNIGVDKAVTILAGLSVLGILGMLNLFYYGANLRAKSKFTA